MLKWLLRIAVVLVVTLGAAFWWLFLDAGVPKSAEGELDIAAYRALVAGDAAGTLPSEMRIETMASDAVPSFAMQAGWFAGQRRLDYTALQLVYPSSTIVIGGGANAAYVEQTAQSDTASFDVGAYARMVSALGRAAQVLITHEHPDHVMAIANFPDPASLAPRLRLTAPQLAALPQYAPDGVLAPQIAAISPLVLDGPVRLAPGLVAVPMPGHSAGTVTFFVRIQDGREYLLIGDIVWMMRNIETLKSRPRILGVIYGLGGDRKAVLRQIRALHDLSAAEPDLIIVPSHDADYLDGLIREGKLADGFSGSPD